MNLKLRHCLRAALLLLGGVLVATGQSQYVEDSIQTWPWVKDMVYSRRDKTVVGVSETENVLFAIYCPNNHVQGAAVESPRRLALDTLGHSVYCLYDRSMDSVLLADPYTGNPGKRLYVEGASSPIWDPVGSRVYVSCSWVNAVAIIDCVTESVVGQIPVGAGPDILQLNSVRRKLYVQNYDDETISVIDLVAGTVIATIPVGGLPYWGYYSAAVDRYYCGTGDPWFVCVIDGAGDTVITRLYVPGPVMAMAGSDEDGLVLAAVYNDYSDSVFAIDVASTSIVGRVPVGRYPQALLWSPASRRYYCAAGGSDNVTVISADGTQVLGTLPVGDWPSVLVAAPEFRRVYVGHFNGSYTYVIRDTASGLVEARPAGPAPGHFMVMPNPFSRALTVVLPAGMDGAFAVRIYSQDGRLVRRLPPTASGRHSCTWDGRDERGMRVPDGVYALIAGDGVYRTQVVKVK